MDSQRLVRDVVAMLGGALTAGAPDVATQAVLDRISADLSRTPWGGGAIHGFLQTPSDPNRQDMLAAALRELANVDPAFARFLTESLSTSQEKAPRDRAGTITVTAGGDQRFRAPVNIGSGTLSVDRSRKFDIKIGLGGLALLLLAGGGVTTGVVLSQGSGPIVGPVTTTTPSVPKYSGKPISIGDSGQLPEGPYDAVGDVYLFAAERFPPSKACLIFSDVAAGEFAAANGAANCPAAFVKLDGELTNSDAYGQPNFEALPADVEGPAVVVSTCAIQVSGGPRLFANVTVTKQDEGWLITAYQKASCQ